MQIGGRSPVSGKFGPEPGHTSVTDRPSSELTDLCRSGVRKKNIGTKSKPR